MTAAVIEVGPATVRGPAPVPADLATGLVAGIDDATVLIDDEPVEVAALCADVLATAAAGAHHLTLVCPTWWTAEQRERLRRAAAVGSAEVVVVSRVTALSAPLTGGWVIVEIADEVVMVSWAGPGVETESVTLPRHPDTDVDPAALVRLVVSRANVEDEIILDAPVEVGGAEVLGRAVTAGLRDHGLAASRADPRSSGRARTAPPAPAVDHTGSPAAGSRVRRHRLATCAAAVLAVMLAGIAATGAGRPAGELAMTVVVEGRVGMQIPAGWVVHRVTDGPGSARVQVVSPSDPQLMIHLTQSGLGDGTVAGTLHRALREQPAGVFVDFEPAAVVAGREVAGYRELRPGREIRWAVFADGPVRIAIGCQSRPGQAAGIRPACEVATRSAHAVF